MKLLRCTSVILLVWTSITSVAQQPNSADYKRLVYDNDFTVGIQLHTRGYGISFRRSFYPTNFRKYGFEADLVNLRHEKEVKSFGILPGNSRGFVLNKINSFYALRAGYFHEKILYDRYDQNGIIVSWLIAGGASIGFLKPVYIEVENPETTFGPDKILIRRYNPVEPQQNILGQASFFQGIGETAIEPGIYLKSSFIFDYFGTDEVIKAIEIGIIADVFRRQIPIFYDYINPSFFFQLFFNVNFGKRWN
ncbi:MAG: hypothetical protein ACK4EX_02025 [Thermaurantimonas sp.]|uniref:hypothetical protein n=1 Tax=Thermaurantimonas sp. TaxID=2681568 RepID=UPI00391CD7CB